jgi:hypothetical protein
MKSTFLTNSFYANGIFRNLDLSGDMNPNGSIISCYNCRITTSVAGLYAEDCELVAVSAGAAALKRCSISSLTITTVGEYLSMIDCTPLLSTDTTAGVEVRGKFDCVGWLGYMQLKLIAATSRVEGTGTIELDPTSTGTLLMSCTLQLIDSGNLGIDTVISDKLWAKMSNIPAAVVSRTMAVLDENIKLTLNNTAANKDFTATNTLACTGLPTTVDANIVKTQLLITFKVENTYAGSNCLDCSTATHNQWQLDLDNAGYADLVNGAKTTGQMLDGQWHIGAQYGIFSDFLIFDTTTQITNIDGKLGVRLANGRSKQASLNVTVSMYLLIDSRNV